MDRPHPTYRLSSAEKERAAQEEDSPYGFISAVYLYQRQEVDQR